MKRIGVALSLILPVAGLTLYFTLRREPVSPAPPELPRVVDAQPNGLVDEPRPITVLFDRPMIPDEDVGTEARLLEIDPPLRGHAVWLDPYAIEFRPESLERGTTYTARVPGHSWNFRSPGLTITKRILEDTVAPDAPLILEFSDPIALEDLRAHTSLGSDFGVRGEGTRFELRPTSKLPLGSKWTWTIRRGLPSGRLRLEEDHEIPFTICAPLAIETVRARSYPEYGGRIEFEFNHPIQSGQAVVEPAVSFRTSRWWDELDLAGDFRPGKTYTVTLTDVEDRFGNRLEPISFTRQMPDYASEIRIRENRVVLERLPERRFPVKFVNVQEAVIRTSLAEPGRELEAWIAGRGASVTEQSRTIAEEPNQVVTLGIPIEDTGVVFLEVQGKSARIQVTDVALHAKLSPNDSLVWTTSLSSGKPIAADVSVHNSKGRELWRGRSDEDGRVQGPGLSGAAYVVARTEEDVAILDLEEDEIPRWRHNIPTGEAQPFRVHFFTDRGIYRPGDLVRLKATLRPVPASALVLIRDPRDRVVHQERMSPSEFGTLTFQFRHRERDPLGTYSVEIDKQSAGNFRVESYRPAPFEVTVSSDKPSYLRGETARIALRSQYFHGAPVQGNRSWSASLEEIEFEPPGWDGYSFGDVTYWPHRVDGFRKGTSDVIDLPLQSSCRGPLRLTVEAEVSDVSHRSVTASGTWTVHSASTYLGIKTDSYVVEAGKEVRIDVIGVTPEGKPYPATPQISVVRREWHTVLKKSAGWSLTYVSEPVDRPVAGVSLDAPGTWSFVPPRSGYYLIRAEAEGAVTVADVYASGEDPSGWSMSDDLRLRLVADKKSYRPGEVAKILVPSPFAGATAFVTVERERILDSRVTTIGASSMLEIPIEAYAPNVYVSVLLVQGRTSETFGRGGVDLGRPTYRIGYLTLPVVDESRRLDVSVSSDRSVYAPRDEVSLEVRTSRPAEVTVMAVDEAVLSLTGYATPDPYAFFSRPMPLEVRSAELRCSVLARTPYDEYGKKGSAGGGGGKEGTPRSKFVPTVYYDVLRCDGTVRLTFRLQDDITRFRIMVFAVGQGDAYGKGQAAIVVRKPLILTSALPRFVRIGDRFEARVLVFSETGGEARVELNGTAMTVPVPRGASVAVGFPSTAERRYRFSATLGPDRDALEVELPVLPAAPMETRLVHGKDKGRFTIRVPALDEMEVTITGNPLAELEGGLQYLLEYPHGCIEQTTSRTLPLLAVRWGGDAPVRALVKGEVRPFAQAGLDRILLMQTSDGFAYWPGGREAHPWGTVYASHALVLASRQGYDVRPADLQHALDSVSKLLRTEASVTVRAYATYVLAIAGRPEPSYVQALLLRPDLTRTAAAFLGVPGKSAALDRDVIYSDLERSVELLLNPQRIDLAQSLLQSRVHGRWSKTVANAFAILALAESLGRDSGPVHVRTSYGEGAEIRFVAPARDFEVEASGPVYWTVRARGSSRETRRIDRGIGLIREVPSEVRAGETVTVRLRVIVRDRAEYVAIEDPLAAGFEPLLESAGSHVERRDDRILIYADRLAPGIHEFSYALRATAPGTFALPPARAEEMYRSDVFGSTAGSTLTIR